MTDLGLQLVDVPGLAVTVGPKIRDGSDLRLQLLNVLSLAIVFRLKVLVRIVLQFQLPDVRGLLIAIGLQSSDDCHRVVKSILARGQGEVAGFLELLSFCLEILYLLSQRFYHRDDVFLFLRKIESIDGPMLRLLQVYSALLDMRPEWRGRVGLSFGEARVLGLERFWAVLHLVSNVLKRAEKR